MVLNLHGVLYLTAFVCFLIAACPTGSRFRFECFAFAALTLTLLV
jgi:hypothetical protein